MPYYEDDDYEDEPYERRRPVRRLRRPRPRYEDEDWEPERRYRPLPHSGFGIASTVLGVIMGVAVFGLLVIAGIMETNTPGGIDEESPQAIVLGVLIIGSLVLSLVGLVLGLVGVFQPQRNKIFPGIGIGVNALLVLGTLAIVCLGMLAGGSM
jgi:hypothetical protein